MWKPVSLLQTVESVRRIELKSVIILLTWVVFIYFTLVITMFYLPPEWGHIYGDRTALLQFFLFNPPLVLGTITLFWLGYEWALIPTFLAMYLVGFHGHLEMHWAILFSLSFAFGLAIYAIVYQCLYLRYGLRNLRSFLVFVVTSFIAATASSLGSFIWSFAQGLSAQDTAQLWNAWWAGSLLQSLIFVAPIIYLLSPQVEKMKLKWFEVPERKRVSAQWIYSGVIISTGVVAIFIYSGDYLGKKRIYEHIQDMDPWSAGMVMGSMSSFEIITWVSIWIIICVGLGGIFLIGSWNKELHSKIEERTGELAHTHERLEHSLEDKTLLLQEIHHRVKNNLAVVTALLDLQEMNLDDEKGVQILSDSRTRVKSMAFIHEILYETENFASVDLKPYLNRLCASIQKNYRHDDKVIHFIIHVDNIKLNVNKAIPVGLILNELVVNAYKHAFAGKETGIIEVIVTHKKDWVAIKVIDDGIGLENENEILKNKSLGITLIKTLAHQLKAQLEVQSEPEKTSFSLKFDKSMIEYVHE